MNSIQRLVFVGSVLVMATATAAANDCDVLRQIMAQAPSKFVTYKGAFEDEVDGSKFYRAGISLTVLHSCDFVEDTQTNKNSVVCSNGAGRDRRDVALEAADQLVNSCGFRIRDTEDFSRGRGTFRVYNVVTDDRKLVKLSTSAFPGKVGNSVRLTVANP